MNKIDTLKIKADKTLVGRTIFLTSQILLYRRSDWLTVFPPKHLSSATRHALYGFIIYIYLFFYGQCFVRFYPLVVMYHKTHPLVLWAFGFENIAIREWITVIGTFLLYVLWRCPTSRLLLHFFCHLTSLLEFQCTILLIILFKTSKSFFFVLLFSGTLTKG